MSRQNTRRVSSDSRTLSQTSESVPGSRRSHGSENSRQLSRSGLSQISGPSVIVTLPSEPAVSTTSRSNQSRGSSASTMLPSEKATSDMPESIHVSRSEGTASRSRASSRRSEVIVTLSSELGPASRRSGGSTSLLSERIGFPKPRSMTDMSENRSYASSGSRRSGSHISLAPIRVSSMGVPPSTINTDLLRSTLTGSRSSGARSGTRASSSSSSTSSSRLPEGPAVTLCECTEPLLNEENYQDYAAIVHMAKHLVGIVPSSETSLQNKLGLIAYCRRMGVSPADIGLTHWGVCHIESSSIPNMQDWTVRAQLDHYTTHCADAEAEAEAQGGPSFGALKRIATTMGCIDHRHRLELDTILQGGDPSAALERLKQCHARSRGHLYRPGCCGSGAYLNSDDDVVTGSTEGSRTSSSRSHGSSRNGGSHASSKYPSNYSGSRASSGHSGSRLRSGTAISGSRSDSRAPSSWRGRRAEVASPGDSASQVSTRRSTVKPSTCNEGRVPGRSVASGSRTSEKTAPSSVWRGGKTESVLPGESASQIYGPSSTMKP